MSIKEQYTVQQIPKKEAYPWILKKHYAKRLPMTLEFVYGVFDKNIILQGICVFGPTSPTVPLTIFGDLKKHKVRELTRLVVNNNIKNICSFFISKCFKLLPKPLCLVSFADTGMNHSGYVYQATNWLYTGEGGGESIYKEQGKEIHLLTLNDRMKADGLNTESYCRKYNITKEKAKPKHRYIYFLGNKNEKKKMRNNCLLRVLDYPKGNNKKYDASYEPKIQTKLF